MGDSDKLPDVKPDTYRFTTHRDHLGAFIDAVIDPKEKVLLVIHDWGSALGFDWANNHRDRVRGIVYMEGIVRPVADWDEWSEAATPVFQGFRSDKGEQMILDRNLFIERVLPGSVLRKLTDAEMTEYRKPFLNREDRWPTLTWPRQIPIGGEPADVVAIADAYAKWMAENNLPKLFVNAEPGCNPDRQSARILPWLEEPDRDHGSRHSLHSGRLRGSHRPRRRGLDQGKRRVACGINWLEPSLRGALATKQSSLRLSAPGLLRFARNDRDRRIIRRDSRWNPACHCLYII